MIAIVVGAGWLLGLVFVATQAIDSSYKAEARDKARVEALVALLTPKIGDYVLLTLANGAYKKGCLLRIEDTRIVLDTTKPKPISQVWVYNDTMSHCLNHEMVLLDVITQVESLVPRESIKRYTFR